MADGASSLVRTDALTDGARLAAREALAGRRRGVRGFLPFAGPAIIASIAYIDPGNFATNIQGGSSCWQTCWRCCSRRCPPRSAS
jgi:hypothetical protein